MNNFDKTNYSVSGSSQANVRVRTKKRTNLIGWIVFLLILIPKIFSFFGAIDYSDYLVFVLCLSGGMLAGYDAARKNTSFFWKNRSIGANAGRIVGLFALAATLLLGFLMVLFVYLYSWLITFEPFELNYGIGTFRATGVNDYILVIIVSSVLIGLGDFILALFGGWFTGWVFEKEIKDGD